MSLTRGARKFLQNELRKELESVGSTRPCTDAEQSFRSTAMMKHSWKVHRLSWPDFVVEMDGKLVFVEVKGPTDGVSLGQIQTFDLLTQLGFEVFIWWEDDGKKLERWTLGMKPRRLRTRT